MHNLKDQTNPFLCECITYIILDNFQLVQYQEAENSNTKSHKMITFFFFKWIRMSKEIVQKLITYRKLVLVKGL